MKGVPSVPSVPQPDYIHVESLSITITDEVCDRCKQQKPLDFALLAGFADPTIKPPTPNNSKTSDANQEKSKEDKKTDNQSRLDVVRGGFNSGQGKAGKHGKKEAS